MGDHAVDLQAPADEIICDVGGIFVGAGIERAVGLEDRRDIGGRVFARKLAGQKIWVKVLITAEANQDYCNVSTTTDFAGNANDNSSPCNAAPAKVFGRIAPGFTNVL